MWATCKTQPGGTGRQAGLLWPWHIPRRDLGAWGSGPRGSEFDADGGLLGGGSIDEEIGDDEARSSSKRGRGKAKAKAKSTPLGSPNKTSATAGGNANCPA
eukprot:7587907-Alexandrium_andersonii.AAC.1